MSSVKVRDVSKSFGSGSRTRVALDNFSASIPDGALCALIGKNGAGKTTLIKCATGIYTPDMGSVYLDGIDILKDKRSRVEQLTVLLDGGRNLYRFMTLDENLRYFTLLKGVREESNHLKSLRAQVIDAMKVGDLLSSTIDKLSYGMAQRAAIAVAIACASSVVILDEPTKGLDFEMKHELALLLTEIKKSFGLTIILSSHDLDFVESISDYLVLIDNGKRVIEGPLSNYHALLNTRTYAITLRGEISEKKAESLGQLHSYVSLEPNRVLLKAA